MLFVLTRSRSSVGNVETALLYRGMRQADRRERALAALAMVGLDHRADHRPLQMSGGEQQRVAIARAIVTEPLMILADEPTGALDSTNAAHVLEIFHNLQSHERAVVMVTHLVEDGLERADRALLLDRDHRVALCATAPEMHAAPEFQHIYGRFVGRGAERP